MAQILTIFNGFVVFTILFFLVFLLTQSTKSRVAKYLANVFLVVSGWLIFEFLGSSFRFSDNYSLLFWRITFSFVFLMTILMLRFIIELVGQKINKYLYGLLFASQLVLIFFSLFTNKIIARMHAVSSLYGKEYETGSLFWLAGISIVFIMLLCLFFLLRRIWVIRKDKDRKETKSLLYIFLGIMIPLVVGSITNLLFPYLNYNFPKLVSPGIFILVIFFMYSIYQWQAFSITVTRLRINTRIILLFLMTAGFLIVSGVLFFVSQTNKIVKEEISSQLTGRKDSVVNQINGFIENNINLSHIISSLYVVQDFMDSYFLSNDRETVDMEQRTRALMNEIVKLETQVLNISFSDKNHKIIWEFNQGYPVFLSEELHEGKTIVYDEHHSLLISKVGSCGEDKRPCLSLVHSVEKNEKEIGNVEIVIDLNKMYQAMTLATNQNLENQFYLISIDGYAVSPLRGKEFNEIFLSFNLGTDMVSNCQESKAKKDGEFLSYDNYGNQKVEGTITYLEKVDLCLINEVRKEVLDSYVSRKILNNLIIGIAMILLLMIFLGRLVANTISKPIIKLQQDVKIIESGDYNHKVGTDARDEIGDLSRTFDKMTEAIKHSREDVERKVKEQTKEITEKQEMLEGQQKAVLNVLEDVEKEKELTLRERDKIDTIVHSIGDGVFVIDENLKIMLINQIALDLAGYKSNEAVGFRYDKIMKFIDEKTKKVSDDFIHEVLKTGERREMSNHTLLISKDGNQIPVSDSAAPVKDKNGVVIGCVVVFRDVTKEREVDKAKTEFVSLSSHQLRTPLTSISWYTEMLESGDAGPINDAQKEYLKEISYGTHRMIDLVNALLNVSRIELGTFAIDPVPTDFVEVSQALIKELKPDIVKKEMNVITKYGENIPKIMADPKLIAIVFQNLLSNAVKYTPEKGTITLEMAVKDSNVLIKVSDTGYGIPKNAKDKMFTKLYRADNVRAKDTTGTGLGLYIVKSIVEKGGGKIWFESVENKGTTFFVELPLSGYKKVEGEKKLS